MNLYKLLQQSKMIHKICKNIAEISHERVQERRFMT